MPKSNFAECREFTDVELMQKFMSLFTSGHHGSYPTAYSAQEALLLLAEILERMGGKR
jgi:hypothetical protein